MKKNIKIGIPDSIFSHLLIFLKNKHQFNKYNYQFVSIPQFNVLEDLFDINYLNLLITYPSFLYEKIINNKNKEIFLIDIFSFSNFSIFTHKQFFKFKFSSKITLKIAIPKNTFYYKTIIKKFLSFFKIKNIKIKWYEILSKDIEYYFESNILDVALVFEKYSYNLISKNIANLIEIPIENRAIPGFSFFYKNINNNLQIEETFEISKELTSVIFNFSKNKDLYEDFIDEFPDTQKHFIKIFVNNIKNLIFHNKEMYNNIDLRYIYYNKKDKIENFVLINKTNFDNLKNLKKDRELFIYPEMIHYLLNLKKLPENKFPARLNIFIHIYNNLLFEIQILKNKLKNQINKNKILSDNIENLKINLYQNFLQLKEVSDNLIVEKIKAEEANKAKTSFFASITHDLKTPLIGIISLTEMLYENETDKDKKNKLKIIMDSSNTLLELINNILTVSKNESVKVNISKKIFSVKSIISEIEENVNAKINNKNVKLIIDIDPELPDLLSGDPLKIKQIIFNLLGNSAKFTHNGYIKLSIKKGIQKLKKIELLINVEDTGIGIEKNKLSKIFLPFEQAGDQITEYYGGTGLGLAIVKKFVELMGGKIKVESELNKGTKFKLNIFCEIVTDTEGDKIKDTIDEIEQKEFLFLKSNILIAEDNIVNQYVIKEYLKDFKNINFDITENGQKALELFNKNKYNLVLTDIQMPVMDGIKLCKEIRKLDNSIPVIAFTAYDDEFISEYKLYGFTEIAKKPYKKKNLLDLFSKYIGVSKIIKRENIKENKEKTQEDENNRSGTVDNMPLNYIKDEITIIKKLNDKINSLDPEKDKIKILFIKSLLNYYSSIKNNKTDFESLRFTLHNIKGTAEIGGLSKLNEYAQKLSKYIKETQNSNKEIDISHINDFLNKFLEQLNTLVE